MFNLDSVWSDVYSCNDNKIKESHSAFLYLLIYTSWSAQSDTQRTYEQDRIYQILRNYSTFRDKLERLQRILDNAVKPEGLELIKFV